jgi:membrane-associated HD superfamily phosphohydrolase
MKLKTQILLSINCIVSFPANASGGSAMEFSLYFFVWFSLIGLVVSSIVKHQTKKRKDTIYIRLIRILPITILVSPSFYIESSDAMLLPSAATVFLSIESFNGTSLVSGVLSIFLTTLAVYAYKYKKTETMQDYDNDL